MGRLNHSSKNESKSDRQQKPMFNVNPSFLGVYVITFDELMTNHMYEFLNTNDTFIGEDEEIRRFKDFLKTPSSTSELLPGNGPSMVVEKAFDGVVVIKFNDDMRGLFLDYLNDVAVNLGSLDPFIWAFSRSLSEPNGREQRSRNQHGRLYRPRYRAHFSRSSGYTERK